MPEGANRHHRQSARYRGRDLLGQQPPTTGRSRYSTAMAWTVEALPLPIPTWKATDLFPLITARECRSPPSMKEDTDSSLPA